MKLNLTHAAIGLAVLFVVYKIGQAKAAQGSAVKPASSNISEPGAWWSYAGAWGA